MLRQPRLSQTRPENNLALQGVVQELPNHNPAGPGNLINHNLTNLRRRMQQSGSNNNSSNMPRI
jgi:hypothetical protein